MKPKSKTKKISDDVDIEALKRHMRLSAKEKLEYLERLNEFLNAAMSPESKEIWQKLKKMGY